MNTALAISSSLTLYVETRVEFPPSQQALTDNAFAHDIVPPDIYLSFGLTLLGPCMLHKFGLWKRWRLP